MEYRSFGSLGYKVSAFGFGAMRLPSLENGKVDEAEAIKMIRHAVDSGVNYFDTAYVYHDGNSEVILGKALKGGLREKVYVATKLPTWSVRSEGDVMRLLDESIKRLGTGYIDFYLVHALNRNHLEKLKKINILGELEKAKAEGKIKHIGFSFHDELDVFKNIVDFYDWEMCQIQLNILDNEYQAGIEGLKYAGAKNIPVVIMEPVKGGMLAKNIPDEALQLYNDYKVKRSPVEWAFRFASDFKEVAVVLSGVSDMGQLKDNIRIFADTAPCSLSKGDIELLDSVRAAYKSKILVGCTGCEYCLPCPSKVAIPEIFNRYNNSVFDMEKFKRNYEALEGGGKTNCIECGACEKVCPQHLPIIEKLKEAAQLAHS
ncbi:MAG: aldo/keto reductase [Clostridiales bacterium]|jgi:predicted aldo/keto reductase-like oxidoreductase|nr:aldo/keto reductase [Clostridiales bacterium]